MLHLFTSNRYECLRQRLLEDLADTPADPFQARQVIIPSLAVRRDLQLALASRDGICTQIDFSFLAQWLWDRMAEVVPVPAISPFAPARLSWRLYRLFGETDFIGPLPRLSTYLAAADERMRFELAGRVARLFEQYITYRPDWLAAWSDDRMAALPTHTSAQQRADALWQAALWRRFTAELGTARQHPSVSFFAAIERLGPSAVEVAGLPPRAHIFALSTVPPLYLDILEQLAKWIDIRLYLLNPCQTYWHEIVENRRLARWLASGKAAYQDPGHPLLAAWGKQTQAMFALLLDRLTANEEEEFVPQSGNTLLAQLHNGILDLAPPERASLNLADDDRSIEFHCCHSLSRELEVLHDQLLDLFHDSKALGPADVLVATPDLDAAAPLIDAIFGAARRIPYQITGRGETRINPVARALLAVLDAATSRFAASTIFGLLRQAPVAAAFRLDENDLECLQEALRAAGVHWGLDETHRAQGGQPKDNRHTWRDALARLLLGYAMPTGPDIVVAGIAPAGHLEGTAALPLGRLWQFIDRLEALARQLAQPHTPGEWLSLWQGLLGDFVADDTAVVEERRSIQNAIAALARDMAEAGEATRIPADVARAALAEALDVSTRGGVPSGAVTFTALPSLRLLPYRVIVLIGMNDGVFPASSRAEEYDLMPLVARPGDRQRRDDDRNLFLDLLLAARERFIVTWTGRSQRDNSPLPLAVPVEELLDFLLAATGSTRQRMVVDHPLQPFSPVYFSTAAGQDPRLSSYDTALCAALQAASPAVAASNDSKEDDDEDEDDDEHFQTLTGPALFTTPLPPLPPGWHTVTLSGLLAFYRHPAQFLLQERLGIRLKRAEDDLTDEDRLLPAQAEGRALRDRLLPAALRASPNLAALATAGPELPAGQIGDSYAMQETAAVQRFSARLAPLIAPPTLETLEFSLDFRLADAQWTLEGELSELRASGALFWRCASAGIGDFLPAWINHLCLNAVAPPGVARETHLVTRDKLYRLRPVDTPHPVLATLLEAYRQGLAAPLPFYPRTAWDYLTQGRRQGLATWAWESSDPWWRLALRGLPEPLGDAFESLAARLLQDLIAHLDEI